MGTLRQVTEITTHIHIFIKKKSLIMVQFEEGQSYVIRNAKYSHHNLAMNGEHDRALTTQNTWGLKDEEIWIFHKSEDDENCWVLENNKYKGYRLAKWGGGDQDTGVHRGGVHRDQSWKFVPDGEHFYIYNLKYEDCRLAKWSEHDVGSHGGDKHDDQKWKVIPMKFAVNVEWQDLMSFNNKSNELEEKKLDVTYGIEKKPPNNVGSLGSCESV